MSDDSRYGRQMLLPGIGTQGQAALRAARVLIAGCGALGCASADALARAGVGTIVVADRDVVERTNLQRQMLFDERDADDGAPKAVAAERRLRAINREIRVESHVVHLSAATLPAIAAGADVIVDGLDNFETRYLLNDLAVATGTPLVYGGAVGMTGMTMTILPHARHRRSAAPKPFDHRPTPCLRCVFPEAPPPGSSPTCDTAGVLGPVVTIVAAIQAAQAIRLLAEGPTAIDRRLLTFDLADHRWRFLEVAGDGPRDDCPCCGHGAFDRIDGREGDALTSLCGRHAIQVTPSRSPSGSPRIDLRPLAERLAAHGTVHATSHLCRVTFATERGDDGAPIEMTLFSDARAILRPLTDSARARSLYDRYVGG